MAITRKTLSLRNDKDRDILQWLEDKQFSYYIKGLIRSDINKNNINYMESSKEYVQPTKANKSSKFDIDF